MNITIICEVLGEPNNGTSIAAYNLIDAMKKRGHNVKVVCPDEDKRGVENYYVLPPTDFIPLIKKIIEKNNVSMPRFDKNIIYEACKDADVVHIMMPLFIAKKTSKYVVEQLHKPVTAGFHAQAENFSSHIGMLHSFFANHLVYLVYNSNLFCRVDAIHYPTQFIRDYFEKEIRHTTPGYVISNGVDSDFVKKDIAKPEQFKDKFCILFIGRISAEKDHMTLLKAISKSKYEKQIQLFLAGQGPLEDIVKKYAKKHLTNQPIIKFYKRDELVTLINQMDLYCHPAEVEIEAISCLEAISCGLVPIIANSPKSATKNFALDERCLFKVGKSKELANKIDYFIEHPEEKQKLSELYIKERNDFNKEECMNKMEQMFIDVINKRKENK